MVFWPCVRLALYFRECQPDVVVVGVDEAEPQDGLGAVGAPPGPIFSDALRCRHHHDGIQVKLADMQVYPARIASVPCDHRPGRQPLVRRPEWERYRAHHSTTSWHNRRTHRSQHDIEPQSPDREIAAGDRRRILRSRVEVVKDLCDSQPPKG